MSANNRLGQANQFEDAELQELLEEDSCHTELELAEQIVVSRFSVGRRFKAMGRILKEENWVPHKINEREKKGL